MPSNADIANLALSNLGADRIFAIDEDSENARKVDAIYIFVRDIVLSAHPWNFAVKRTTLALLAETPEFDFTYAFQLPPDYIRVLDTDIPTGKYKIEAGKKLLSNDSAIKIKYIARIEDPEQFSYGFIVAFSGELAAQLAYPITNSNSTARGMRDLALLNLRIGKAQDAQEGTPEDLDANQWRDSRAQSGGSTIF